VIILPGRTARWHQGIINKRDDFTVNIGLIKDGIPVAGDSFCAISCKKG